MADFDVRSLERERRVAWLSQVAGAPIIPEAQTYDRHQGWATATLTLTSGRLNLSGGAIIVPTIPVRGIAYYSVGAYTPGTNYWFTLVDALSGEVLAKTPDQTTTAWGANARKAISFTTPYSPKGIRPVYLGIVVVGGTPPTIRGISGVNNSPANEAPGSALYVTAGGLTDPASLGATIVLPTDVTTDTLYPYAHWY